MNRKEFVILIATTCLVILVWIATDIYRSKASVTVSPSLKQALEPLNPDFDQKALDQIKKLGNIPLPPPPTPITSPTPIPITTPNPTPQQTIASPSASVLIGL